MAVFRREHVCEWRERAEALALELDRLRTDAAFEDPATGVGNLPQLNRDFTKLLGRARRYGQPFALVLVEVRDYVESSNDLDVRAITQLARVLVETARTEDYVSRAGPFEFAVLLPGAEEPGARAFLERARRNLSSELCKTASGTRFFQAAGGVAVWDESVAGLHELLDLADADRDRYAMELDADAARFRARSTGAPN